MHRRIDSAPLPMTAAPAGTDSRRVVLERLVELWSLLDAASRTYAQRARGVPAPTRLLLWSLSHRRSRHAARLLALLSEPQWAGRLIGDGDPAEYLRRWRSITPPDEQTLGQVEALQRAATTEGLLADRCGRVIAATAHTLVEHALRWQLADIRFAQHQVELLMSMLGLDPSTTNGNP
jgi:hypothetical protein